MNLIKDLGKMSTPQNKQLQFYGLYQCPRCEIEQVITHRNVRNMVSNNCRACSKSDAKTIFKTQDEKDLAKRFHSIKKRCYNKTASNYDRYGGKGVTICKEWLDDITIFVRWALDNGYSSELHIDKDVLSIELGIEPHIYSPSTCQFVTIAENNKAKTLMHN